MGRKRQKNQLLLAFAAESRDEFPMAAAEGTELPVAKRDAENPTQTASLMEEVCQRDNLWKALKRVRANKGAPGVDGMTVRRLPKYLKRHWPKIRDQLLAGTYRPQPVKRVEIPKPDGGVRKLGIPTALDRFIQQAVGQVLGACWDRTFSEHSYGFRPGRSAHQAVARAQAYIAEGYGFTVDMDLEKFFDRVNHDILMGRVAKRVEDKRMLKLIRAFLNAGVMENGLVSPSEEGTPQGGPLSPLLSNLLLDDLLGARLWWAEERDPLDALGIEGDPDLAAHARSKGLAVEERDLRDYLAKAGEASLGTVVLCHVLEHLLPAEAPGLFDPTLSLLHRDGHGLASSVRQSGD